MKFFRGLFLVFATLFFIGCERSEYTKMVKRELAKGIRNDSILLGINLGDTQKEFFDKCLELNRQHLATQGGAGVLHMINDSTVHKTPTSIQLIFLPELDEHGKIAEMNLSFSYTAWAPWNQQLQADSLETKIKMLLEKWYGGNRFVDAHVGNGTIPAKVDGNRRLLIYRKDAQTVVVRVQDLLHPMFKKTIE